MSGLMVIICYPGSLLTWTRYKNFYIAQIKTKRKNKITPENMESKNMN